ncbi:MAG: response regulator [Ignavibacteria bacterium]|jgi:CheY-like chemotaxis protein/signal transduction histidine kinase|nr:response regulator [Ignavibacteria bacterium]MCU7504541.1 response regulator [Ignavibacteria bacterium]MCU7516621.1 response regulator [Ignavibacteria bacterium]
MQSVKLEFLEKYNYLNSLAERGHEQFTDELCDYIVNEFELQAMVLFKVNDDESLMVLGRSASAKKNYTRGAIFRCPVCSLVREKNPTFQSHSDAECQMLISEFVIYEACMTAKITEGQRGFIKFAKKTPFLRAEIDNLRSVSEFLGYILRTWSATRGESFTSAGKSVSEIINDISQELRTPANSIIGFASLLGEDSLTSSQSEYISIIKSNAQNLLLTLNDLIEASKIDSGKIQENRTLTEVKKLVDDIIKIYSSKTDPGSVELTAEFDSSMPEKILVDVPRLKYILQNILQHSIRMTERGKIVIRMALSGKNQLSVRVSDTGRGITSEQLKNVFEPFAFSAIDHLKTPLASGLGLTLAKKYVNFLGGDISVESAIGRGTTFIFTLGIEAVSEIEKKILNLPAPEGSRNKVLVIEDDYATSKLLSNYLNKWGYEPTIVNNAEQTMIMIEKEKFLAIIMDIVLPNTNGLELLKTIHEHKHTKNTPVIVCSIEAEQQKAFMLGAVEYFVKPIKYKFLVEVLQSYRLKKDSTVLCVDDDLPTLNLLKEAIVNAGYNALAEQSSAKVMDLIRDKDLDLAIVDLDMPEPNGFELIKLIKSDSNFARLPIIIYTGKENYQEDLMKIDGLFEDLLSKKSTNIEDLAQTINEMINRNDVPLPPQEIAKRDNVIKILLAEDYKHSQIIVTRLLKKNSFENIIVVENGEEALENAQKQHFDLILMDMQMPVMNGFEATEKIRLIPEYKDTPIVALTAFAMKGDREKCLEAGATDYIPKPIDSKEFIEKVKYYTSLKKVTA